MQKIGNKFCPDQVMLINQKKQYALRAVYELAKHQDGPPLKSAKIARSQAIPQRFLEIILNQLKHAGIVSAKRGYTGGFRLNRPANEITVREIFQALEETCSPATACVSCISNGDCPFYGSCVFMPLWNELQSSIDQICRSTTIQKLVDSKRETTPEKKRRPPNSEKIHDPAKQ
jgi:Rrf2 family protein